MGNLKMTTIKTIATLILLTVSQLVIGQTFEKSFQGWWATTSWTFDFKEDGTYKRTSSGHYGNTVVEGKYKINGDTITLLTGFENTHGTVNQTYILDKDSLLIDLDLRYDYAPISNEQANFYNSKIRQVKYPQTQARNEKEIEELEKVLNLAFNSKTAKQYYHFDKFPARKLLVADYFNLKASIQVDSTTATFLPKDEIESNFYIEFTDINQNNDRIEVKIKINGEGVAIWFYYVKKDGKWIEQEPYVTEN
ncbi:MAG: hypothetical protein Kow0075_14930 [Salibacteraceae bacterium]